MLVVLIRVKLYKLFAETNQSIAQLLEYTYGLHTMSKIMRTFNNKLNLYHFKTEQNAQYFRCAPFQSIS